MAVPDAGSSGVFASCHTDEEAVLIIVFHHFSSELAPHMKMKFVIHLERVTHTYAERLRKYLRSVSHLWGLILGPDLGRQQGGTLCRTFESRRCSWSDGRLSMWKTSKRTKTLFFKLRCGGDR